MTLDEKQKETAQKDFLKAAENYSKLLDLTTSEEKNFLQIKLGFVGVIGIILSILFGQNSNDFNKEFIIWFVFILMFSVVVLVVDLWIVRLDMALGTKKQIRVTLLKKIRAIAAVNEKLEDYGHRAEILHINEDKIKQAMLNGEPISSIIKTKTNIWFYASTILWTLILLSIPIIFLLEVLLDSKGY